MVKWQTTNLTPNLHKVKISTKQRVLGMEWFCLWNCSLPIALSFLAQRGKITNLEIASSLFCSQKEERKIPSPMHIPPLRSELHMVACFYLENSLFINHGWQSCGIDSLNLNILIKCYFILLLIGTTLLIESVTHSCVELFGGWASLKLRKKNKQTYFGEIFSIPL